jgi:hypothetical protein
MLQDLTRHMDADEEFTNEFYPREGARVTVELNGIEYDISMVVLQDHLKPEPFIVLTNDDVVERDRFSRLGTRFHVYEKVVTLG